MRSSPHAVRQLQHCICIHGSPTISRQAGNDGIRGRKSAPLCRCIEMGAKLVSIHSASENAKLFEHAAQDFFPAMRKQGQSTRVAPACLLETARAASAAHLMHLATVTPQCTGRPAVTGCGEFPVTAPAGGRRTPSSEHAAAAPAGGRRHPSTAGPFAAPATACTPPHATAA
jgi:hypothetical protein